jgi:hypothetical protein
MHDPTSCHPVPPRPYYLSAEHIVALVAAVAAVAAVANIAPWAVGAVVQDHRRPRTSPPAEPQQQSLW